MYTLINIASQAGLNYEFLNMIWYLQTLCGDAKPSSSYTSSSNIMTIYFTTDYSVNDKGFRAAWKEVN